MNSCIQINQDSGNKEYYTPPYIINKVKQVIGKIDLDPFSNETANTIVQAKKFYGIYDESIKKEWKGTVFMNHPFGKGEIRCIEPFSECKKKVCQKRGYHIDYDIPSNKQCINHIVEQYENGNITKACCITFNSTGSKWINPLLKYPQAIF